MQYYTSGDWFINFILDLFYTILAFFSDVWLFFTSPFGLVIEDVLLKLGYDVSDHVMSFIDSLGLYDISLISFMFGSGLVIFLSISLIKWVMS